MQMLLTVSSRTVRLALCEGLRLALKNTVDEHVLDLAVDLNSVKHGLADIALDFDKVFGAMQAISGLEVTKSTEISLLTYCSLHLVTCDEYSVRDYTLHALAKLIPRLSIRAFGHCERQLISYIRQTQDEMVLKSIMQAVKIMVECAKTDP